jgi:hypothetical protein
MMTGEKYASLFMGRAMLATCELTRLYHPSVWDTFSNILAIRDVEADKREGDYL